jgi:hypothetical protein
MPLWLKKAVVWGIVAALAFIPASVLSALWFGHTAGFPLTAIFGPRSREFWTMMLPIGVPIVFAAIIAMFAINEGAVAVGRWWNGEENSN